MSFFAICFKESPHFRSVLDHYFLLEKKICECLAKVTTALRRKIVAQFWSPARQRAAARRVPLVSHRATAAETEIKRVIFSRWNDLVVCLNVQERLL